MEFVSEFISNLKETMNKKWIGLAIGVFASLIAFGIMIWHGGSEAGRAKYDEINVKATSRYDTKSYNYAYNSEQYRKLVSDLDVLEKQKEEKLRKYSALIGS